MKIDTIGIGKPLVAVPADPSPRPSDEPRRPAPAADRWDEPSPSTAIEVRYSVDPATRQVIYRIYDLQTDQYIGEMPPEKLRQLSENISKIVASS